MRVVHLSTSEAGGGAARAAQRLHRGLLEAGVDSSMLVAERSSRDPRVVALNDPAGRRTRRSGSALPPPSIELRRALSHRPADGDFFSEDRSAFGPALRAALPAADVVHLHWVARLLDYEAFFGDAATSTPIVWTLHDMNPFTGGCHYSWSCERFHDACGACPQLASRDPDDLSRTIHARKAAAFARAATRRLHVVTPSRWLASEAGRSRLMRDLPIASIPNGVDTDAFAPRDRVFARTTLGLPPNAFVVLLVAYWTSARFKGLHLVPELLGRVRDMPNLFVLAVGRSPAPLALPVPHRQVQPVDDDRLLSLFYSAADVYLLPSLQDNFPNTVLEAHACGTPVAAFASGGVPELVLPGVTGALAPVGDVAALGAAIRSLHADTALRTRLGAQARRIVLEHYTLAHAARRYAELYQSLATRAAPRIGAAPERAAAEAGRAAASRLSQGVVSTTATANPS
ncbi:MAG: glycosyltransferase [Phycisphaerae bacterium]